MKPGEWKSTAMLWTRSILAAHVAQFISHKEAMVLLATIASTSAWVVLPGRRVGYSRS